LLPIWEQILKEQDKEIACILVFRHPQAVIQSLRVRDHFSHEKAAILWLDHVLEAERQTRHIKRFWIDFDQLLLDPFAVLLELQAHFHLSLESNQIDQKEAIQGFIDPQLNHAAIHEDIQLHPWLQQVYKLHMQFAQDTESVNSLEQLDNIYDLFNQTRKWMYTPEIHADIQQLDQMIHFYKQPLRKVISGLFKDRISTFWQDLHTQKRNEKS